MSRRGALPAFLLLALLTPAFLAGCATPSTDAPDVVATVYPAAFLAQRIGGESLAVRTLVPAGVEPHDWEPSAADVTGAAGAKLLVAHGAGFEPWLDGFLGALGRDAPPVVYAASNLPLRAGEDHDDHGSAEAGDAAQEDAREGEAGHDEEPGAHGGEAGHEDAQGRENETGNGDEASHDEEDGHEEGALDPHVWLDPVLYAREARNVQRALEAAFPEDAAGVRARADALVAELEALDAAYAQGLASCDIRTIVANHDAYGYLASRYNFTVVAISGLSPEAEPSPRDLQRAIEAARAHDVTVIFFEELVSPRVAEVVAEEVGATTRVLSPVESLTAEQRAAGEDYLSLMRTNLDHLREAMRCQ